MKEETTSEFGQGLTYCLGLFLAHEWKGRGVVPEEQKLRPDFWFNASSDHLCEMIIPEGLPNELKIRLEEFKSKCLDWGHGLATTHDSITEAEIVWSIHEAKELLRLLDKSSGIKTKVADFG